MGQSSRAPRASPNAVGALPEPRTRRTGAELLLVAFAALFGAFLGLTLLKFGNPPIMEKWNTAPRLLPALYSAVRFGTAPPDDWPTLVSEFIVGYPWPTSWAYAMLGLVGAVGLAAARWKSAAPKWLVALPLVWLLWQLLACSQSLNAELSAATVKHFCACVLCFYLGYFSLSRVRNPWPFWIGLLCGLLLVLKTGWDQHFGGLQATRRYVYLYFYDRLAQMPPEYLKRLTSTRIFATFLYPNAFAGLLLVLLPGALGVIWDARQRLTAPARAFLVLMLGAIGLACLYWSGSKAGWLLMLLMGLIVLLRLPFRTRFKAALILLVLVAGLAGFVWKHAAFFQNGATSVSARFDYWRAALQIAWEHPVLGTGPGTFAIPYARIKRPESEMARLVHNDYLEQASDSGVIGFLAYTGVVAGALAWSFRRGLGVSSADGGVRSAEPIPHSALWTPHPALKGWLRFAVWLGVLGWSLQGFVEFGLYTPGSAWPTFTFLGWLLGTSQKTWTETGLPPTLPPNENPLSQRPEPEFARPTGAGHIRKAYPGRHRDQSP